LAVAHELKRLRPDIRIVYVGQKGDKLLDIPTEHPAIDEVHTVSAGKFRRYHGEGWWQLLDLKTQFQNIRDGFRVLAGIWQSWRLMKQLRPVVIFTRGGFVSVPVAIGGHLNGIPYITHESDSVPSLANRLIARWADLHAVALPEELYPYPRRKTRTVGIPLSHDYVPMTVELTRQYKHQLGLPHDCQLLLVTGGGNGAEPLNAAVVASASWLLQKHPKLHIAHIAGRALENGLRASYEAVAQPQQLERVEVIGFTTDFYLYSGAADVVISRAGATTMAEFAEQGKACIIVPAEQLVGGHQVKNAQVYAKHGAIKLFTQAQAEQERRLATAVSDLLDDDAARTELGRNLHGFAKNDAAHELSGILLDMADKKAGA
jgi:UDP-N-acetylglucosamine--N-acetylmuramyl-(pentapeptide) pyrophosphoryl-undecaprenol N-acetylglucosamine transferase